MKTYTFAELSLMDSNEVKKIKDAARERLAEINQRKYADIAAILYYQDEIIKGIER